MLWNPYLIGIGIPLALLATAGLLRKIVRGPGWRLADFYLGVEISLATLGSNALYLYELGRDDNNPTATLGAISYLLIAFLLLLVVIALHQDWESRPQNPKGQRIVLGLVCNTIGVTLFAGFVVLVKGV